MRIGRAALGACGIALVLVGLWHLLVSQRPDLPAAVSIVLFAAGGLVAHDAVIAPLVVLLGAVALPRLPSWSRAPVVVGAVVLGSVTLAAVPVLGRFGAKPDDPWLLPRPYGVLEAVLAGTVLLVVVVASLLRRRRASTTPSTTAP
jgi:hypothetical protein